MIRKSVFCVFHMGWTGSHAVELFENCPYWCHSITQHRDRWPPSYPSVILFIKPIKPPLYLRATVDGAVHLVLQQETAQMAYIAPLIITILTRFHLFS